jgi:hypothetical protein
MIHAVLKISAAAVTPDMLSDFTWICDRCGVRNHKDAPPVPDREARELIMLAWSPAGGGTVLAATQLEPPEGWTHDSEAGLHLCGRCWKPDCGIGGCVLEQGHAGEHRDVTGA